MFIKIEGDFLVNNTKSQCTVHTNNEIVITLPDGRILVIDDDYITAKETARQKGNLIEIDSLFE